MAPSMFDVFLSHNSRDKPSVERLAEGLKRTGLEPWLDKWCLTPGGNWQNELSEGIEASRACAFFLGPHGEGAWARQELHVALDKAAKDRDFRLFLVLLPGIEEPFDTTGLPPFLSMRTWVDLRKGVDDARAFQALVHAIKGIPLGPEAPIARQDDVCPYRGLQTFDEEHAEYFFGRDPDVQRLLEKLKTSRFLAVLGSSGSGKSSVVRAGLLPALKRGNLPGSERWQTRTFTPGAHPLEALAAQLVRLDPQLTMRQTLDQLADDPRALHLLTTLALSDRLADVRVTWVVDQCEEVFTLCQDDDERRQFLDTLLYAATIPDGRTNVVLTMRADFYPRCAAYPDFSNHVAAQQYLVSPMDRAGLRQCIEEPARRVGLELEPGLVDTILHDVSSQPGALPLLEHALLELWERRRGYVLTLEGYREAGGVHGALAQRADAIYLRAHAEEQHLIRRVMLRLTQPGEGTEDTRRRARFRELLTVPEERHVIDAVVGQLAGARLLTVNPGDDGEPIVDIAHEALIRSWPRLQEWLDEDRAALRVQHRLAEAAEEWRRLGQDPDQLFRGARLAEALEWREAEARALNEAERGFLEASVAMRDHELAERERARLARERLRRRITTGLGVGFLVSLVLGGLAGVQWRGAEDARALAEEERIVARSAQAQAERQTEIAFARHVAAQAEVLRTGRANLLPHSVALAAESLRRLDSAEAAQTLRRGLSILARPVASATHGDAIQEVVVSPDGRLVATGSRDGTARVWEVTTGREVARLAHTAPVATLVFSPDGRYLATGDDDGVVRLWETASAAEVAQLRHADVVNALAFSPDGRSLATGSEDRTALLWDVATREVRARLTHDGPVHSVTFRSDGLLLGTASSDRTARLWNVAEGTEVARLTHGRAVVRVRFSPDGTQLATASDDGIARVWSVASGTELARFTHDREVTRLAFSPDGRFLATAGRDMAARIWDLPTQREVTRLGHETSLNAITFSPDGRYVATASSDATARVWDPMTGRELTRMPHERGVWTLAFTPNSRYLVTGTVDGNAQVWETTIGREQLRFTHDAEVVGLAFAPSGQRLVTASLDRTARVWDTTTGRELARLAHDGGVDAVAYSGDGRFIATGSRATGGGDGRASVWDAMTFGEIRALPHGRDVVRVAFSPDSRLLATASDDGTARLWDFGADQEVARIVHRGPVTRIAFSPDGQRVATGSDDNTVQLFDLGARRVLATLPHPDGPVMELAFTADSRQLATASLNRGVRLWNARDGSEIVRVAHTDLVTGLALSPDGQLLAVTTTDSLVRVWRDAGATELPRRAHDTAFVYASAFSPDGRWQASAGGDRTVRLWDALSGQEQARYTHEREALRVAFSPDGTTLATASRDGTARLWPVGREDLAALACQRLVRNLLVEEWQRYFGDAPFPATCSG